jgi:hypothetical protein
MMGRDGVRQRVEPEGADRSALGEDLAQGQFRSCNHPSSGSRDGAFFVNRVAP